MSCPLVDEIIIIDNNQKIKPDWKILKNARILMVHPPSNIFVNPAWNLGVRLSKNNNICILNDDLIFDLKVFEFMSGHLDKTLCGLSMNNKDSQFSLREIDERPHGFGCMMFIRKDKYYYIPKDLLIFYGDDYLFFNNKVRDAVYCIDGCNNNLTCGVTSTNLKLDPDIVKIVDNEKERYRYYTS